MDRTSSSAYSSSSTYSSTSTAPTMTSGAIPTHNTTDRNEYAELLARFPEKLHEAIEATFPNHDELVAFHQDFVDKELQLENEGLVAFVLHKAREQKLIAQRRILFLPLRQSEAKNLKEAEEPKKTVKNTEPPLHEAILTWDGVLVRELLREGASPAEVLRPEQREREVDAMVSVPALCDGDRTKARKKLGLDEDEHLDSKTEDELAAGINRHIVNELLRAHDHAVGVRATVFAEHAGENALTLAISYEAPMKVIALLVEHCARHVPTLLNQPDVNGNLPLTLAAASGNLEIVKLLLRSGAPIDIDQCNGKGHSALMEAARCGNTAIIELLLEHGARADLPNAQGRTARELAAIRENMDAFKALADWEISLSGETQDMSAKLAADLRDAAVRGNTSVLETVHAKLGQCVDATTLREAVQRSLWQALEKNGNAPAITWLIGHGADTELANDKGILPEELASDCGNFEALMSFVFPNEPQRLDPARRQALLHRAAQLGSMRLVVYALDGGADVNGADPDTGMPALATAVLRDDRDTIKTLLQRGAQACVGVAADDDEDDVLDGACPLAIAAKSGGGKASELVMFLVEHHPAPYAEAAQAKLLLHIALELELPPLLERLIRDGQVDYAAYDAQQKSLLKVVAQIGSGELMRTLLRPPAPVRRLLNAENGNADAVLDLLANEREEKSVDVFDAILEACDISPHDNEDQLLDRLCLSVKARSLGSCELILKKGKLRLRPDTPRTHNPLMLAVRCGNLEVIPLLLKHGASACAMARRNLESESRKSALHVAWERGKWDALPILMNHDPRLSEELGAILPSLLALIERGIMEAERVPMMDEVFPCLLRHTQGMKVPMSTLQALLFSAARSGNSAAIAELLKRGADPQQEHPSGDDALVLLLNSPNCSLECAGILLDAMELAPKKAAKVWDSTFFGVPGYGVAQEKKLLTALTDSRIDSDRKIDIMSALILAKPLMPINFSARTMIEMRAKDYMKRLKPIAKSIAAKEPMNVLSQVLEAAKKKAGESDEQWQVDLIDICRRVWDV